MEQKPLSEVKPHSRHIQFRKLLGYRNSWHLHTFLATRPTLYYLVFNALSRNKSRPVGPDTALVVSAAGGCGNTYARNAARLYLPERHFSSHKHLPMEIIQAVRHQVPCLVLIRHPVDSISSVVSRGGYRYNPNSLEWALKDYAFFYENAAKYKDHYVAATFEDVVTDYVKVIERVNARFGTDYRVPANGSADAEALRNRGKWRSENRYRPKSHVREALQHEYYDVWRERAIDVYRWFSDLHDLPVTDLRQAKPRA